MKSKGDFVDEYINGIDKKMWLVAVIDEMPHVIPLNDLIKHEESASCHCDPCIEYQGSGDAVVIHNSYDHREICEMENE